MKIVVITGSSSGIGKATSKTFLDAGYIVHGIDVVDSDLFHDNYHHHIADVCNMHQLPDISDVNILINNAGVQNSGTDIQVNLIGLINTTEKYALHQPSIESVVNMASVSAHNGAEFGEYVASKGGVLSYTRWSAKELAPKAICNSISFGGVLTPLNNKVILDNKMWNEIMCMTPMKKWCTAEEAAEWIYFIAVKNKSMTGQDLIIDNGEMINHRFIWN